MIIINNALEGVVTLGKKKGKDVQWQPPFNNLITDTGLNTVATSSLTSAVTVCRVGTGTTPASPTDTSIENQLGVNGTSPATSVNNSGGVPSWSQYISYIFTFPVGAVVGEATEVYFGTGSTIFSRTLIKNSEGTLAPFTILADEQLIVKYEVRKYPPALDSSGVYTISVNDVDTDYAFTLRAANVNTTLGSSYWYGSRALGTVDGCVAYQSQLLGSISGSPGGTAAAGSVSLDPYITGSFKRTGLLTWNTGAANFGGGIGSIGYCGGNSSDIGFQVSFSPPIPKTSDNVLKIPFEVVWSRR